ncbi:UDP-2,3-diacylglucosamine diphosphatase [Sulfurimonas sp.]
MYHKKPEILEGAFVISDAHYSLERPELLQFIRAIDSKKLCPPQLIFMGDIFDTLFGGIPYTYKDNQELIDLINEISLEIEVIYLEGNHDFNLCKLFVNAVVYPIQQQPVLASYKNKKVYLAHGDFDGETFYKLYTAWIRNPFTLFVLKYIDLIFNHFILKKLDAYLAKKDDCKKFRGFKEFIQRRFEGRFKSDYFIEGHFHQNEFFRTKEFNYINLGAFACNQRYFIIEYSKDNSILREKKFSKEK